MKKFEFENMILNAPKGATHYKRRERSVIFYRDIDLEHGSYSSVMWWTGDSEPFREWYTRRSFLNMNNVIEMGDTK